MNAGGNIIGNKTATIIRYAGILLPIILIAYGFLISFEYVRSTNYIGEIALVAIAALWMLVGVYQFLVPNKSRETVALRLTLYHLLSAAYLLFVTGMSTPFVAAWIILLIVSGTYFSTLGVILSLSSFVLTIAVDMMFVGMEAPVVMATDVAVLIAMLFCGVIAMAIVRSQQIDKMDLETSREQEALQHKRILTIINSLTDAVISADTSGVIRLYNAASLGLLDTNDDIEGKSIDAVVPLFDEKQQPIALSDVLKKQRTIAMYNDWRYRFDDGEYIRLELTVSPIRSTFDQHEHTAPQDGFIIMLRDITKEKSLEEERDEFISVVSHELRTPITVAEGSISNLALMLDRPDIDDSILKKAVESAHDQTVFLARMVNDLSTLSRAERGIADGKEIIDVEELSHKLYDTYHSEANDKGLQLNLDLGTQLGSVFSSRLYLEELLQNFITNAIKYTKDGSVTLCVRARKRQVTFTVKDTGIGIGKSDREKIFDKFYRSEDYRTRETGGTGLGLYVASKLARKINTSIELTSRINHGSSFSITLPLTDKKSS